MLVLSSPLLLDFVIQPGPPAHEILVLADPFLSSVNPSGNMLRHWEMCASLDCKSSQVDDEDELSITGPQEVARDDLTLYFTSPRHGPHFLRVCWGHGDELQSQ